MHHRLIEIWSTTLLTFLHSTIFRHFFSTICFSTFCFSVFSLWKFLLSTFNHLFIRTYVSVDYAPPTLSAIVENLNEEANQLNEIKNRINLVWSLAILDQANQQHAFYYRHIFHFLVFVCPLPFFLLTLRFTLLGNKIKKNLKFN